MDRDDIARALMNKVPLPRPRPGVRPEQILTEEQRMVEDYLPTLRGIGEMMPRGGLDPNLMPASENIDDRRFGYATVPLSPALAAEYRQQALPPRKLFTYDSPGGWGNL